MIPGRVVIYVSDVRNMLGLSDGGARALLKKIRKALGKTSDQFITVKEFCDFTTIKEELVREFIKK